MAESKRFFKGTAQQANTRVGLAEQDGTGTEVGEGFEVGYGSGSEQGLGLDAMYSLDEIMANAKALVGVQPEVMSGAFYGLGREAFTVQEVKDLVQQFLEKRVE